MGEPPAEGAAPWTLRQVQGDDGAKTGSSLLAKHYPNDLLISGFDILFFWDARMAMQGIHFMGEGGRRPLKDSVPWKRLYLHGLVRAADGQKMSKSKGNVVDPLLLIEQYGADALRFFMAAMESQGRDVKMDEKRVEGYRNFATKLWNAVRFAQANGIGASTTLEAPAASHPVNQWIIGEVCETLSELDKAFADLRFDAAAHAIYHFVWDRFCDWYLELIKGGIDAETRAVAGWVIDQILVMLHPFMPFITEELWHAQGERACDLILAQWPVPDAQVDHTAKAEIEHVIEVISAIRAQRTEIGIAPGAKLYMAILDDPKGILPILQANTSAIERAARVIPVQMSSEVIVGLEGSEAEVHSSTASPTFQMISNPSTYWRTSIQIPTESLTLVLGVDGVIDIAAERARLTKSLEAAQKEAKSLEGRLANPAFVEKAKPEAVDKARADHAEKSAEAARLAAALARLG